MTIFAGPMDGGNMNQAQWREVESKLWSDGVIANARNAFVTTTTTGLGISVNTGDAVVDGFRFYADAATALTAAAADPSLPRIDLVVLRIHEDTHATAEIAIKTGTPAGSPVAPTATKVAGGTYELGIYQLRVNAGATTIASLTDVRTYTAPGNAVSKLGDTSTGRQTVSQALGGSIQEFFRLTATDGKIYALCLNTDGTFVLRDITDGINTFVSTSTGGGQFADAVSATRTLSGANKTFLDITASDGKRYQLQITTTGAIQLFNVTDAVTVAVFGPAAGTLWAGPSSASQVALLSGATFAGTVNVSSGALQQGGKGVVFAQAGLTGKFSAQSTAPTSPADGDLWLDTSIVLS